MSNQCSAEGLQRKRNLVVRAHTETAEVPETTDRVACPAVKPEVDAAVFQSLDIRVGLIVSKALLHLGFSVTLQSISSYDSIVV